MADMENTFLINSLLRAVSHERPLDLAALAEHGISPALAAHYARTGWLHRLAKGVYCVAGGRLDRDQCLLFLQDRVPGLHVGARTALAWQGVRQYLEAREQLTMWATARGDLPEWFTDRFPGTLTSLRLFDNSTSSTGVVTPPAVADGLRVSCRERALLELLRAVRTDLQLQEARELFFATLGLRVAMTGELLAGCTSVKTVRLFLMWATEAGNVDVDALRNRYDLPTGSQSRWIGTLADGTRLVLPARAGKPMANAGAEARRGKTRPAAGPERPETVGPALSQRRIVTPVELGLAVDVDALAQICDRYEVAELAVFGSALTGTMTEDSDLDVLYVLRDGVHLGWAVNDLSDELTELLGRQVDLVAKNALHERLRDSVLSEAQVVYAA